jgi:hypothetical protein
LNAVETAVSVRAEKGSGHHEGPGSSAAIGSLLNPANDSVTRLSFLFHNRFVWHLLWSRGVSAL